MSPSPQLAPAGSSIYSSDSMYVGDGTWDSSRNTFLLPNLVGLNFETMRYNGMGNRFRDFAGYHSLITGHGVLAAITFLGVVPAAILFARFYHRDPRLALRMHIWLQILTVAFTIVIFTLGFFAVGPERSLTNPHHGIGTAIFVLVLVQAIGGGIIHRAEKGKDRFKIPLKLMMHQWFGRAIALLGIIQIALGLTLYGSPRYLFILYAVVVFALLLLYFILTYRNQPVGMFDDGGTYISGARTDVTRTDVSDRRSHRARNLGALAVAGAAGAGLASARRRSRSRRGGEEEGRTDVASSQHSSRHRSRTPSGSFLEEKHREDDRNRRDNTWRNRLLGAGVGVGALAGLRGLLNRRNRDRESDVGSYAPPPGGASTVTQTDLSRIEEGRAPMSPNDRWARVEQQEAAQAAAMASPTRPRVRARRSGESLTSYDSRTSFTDDRDGAHGGGHTARNGIAALGVAGFLRHKFTQRRDRKEERRVAEVRQREQENERIVRDNSRRQRRHTGDGAPRHSSRDTRRTSLPESSAITGSNPELSRHTLRPPPLPTTNTRLPTGDVPTLGNRTVVFDGIPAGGTTLPPNTTLAPTTTAPVFVPPATYDPPVTTYNTASAPGPYIPRTNGPNPNNNMLQDVAAAAAAGAAAGAAGAAANSSRHRSTSRQRSSNGEGSVGSPPVSVKVKMHNDGRHVTLRRLNEAEAAAERDTRRRERHRRRAGSLSSVSGNDDRWRRAEAREAAEAQQIAAGAGPRPRDPMPTTLPTTLPPPPPGPPPPNAMGYPGPAMGAPPPPAHAYQTQTQMPLPPPPIPAAASAMGGSVGSPGAYGTETDVSNYDSNRRRRRAERAQAKLAAKQSGSRVEFT
ncbi:hypothetical protein W97_02558 [Coniosporium apollinis CBS 100218]|uniref:Cytochrome b561 domain-containing protein n=1 Tax=Coniosporium apollinis (strain CBS 100218) TaxID=1168221 RepID=R7YNU2_CONA1|nr:uncharacterized protein W97_02558 [Coniosporium apollinis CBS 100218]EON63331.1 hypothetical protein W97_02558 [Coniosporium apollinis CBS 100218]